MRLVTSIFLLAAILLLIVIAAASLGAAHASWRDALSCDGTARAILIRIRLARVIAAALIGATLAVAGVTFQTLLRNPLAD